MSELDLIDRLMLNSPVVTQDHMDAATEIMPQAAARIRELEAEREKLRQALEGLLAAIRVAGSPDAKVSLKEHRKAKDDARAALAETEGE